MTEKVDMEAIKIFVTNGITPYIAGRRENAALGYMEYSCDAIDHINALIDALESVTAERDAAVAEKEVMQTLVCGKCQHYGLTPDSAFWKACKLGKNQCVGFDKWRGTGGS